MGKPLYLSKFLFLVSLTLLVESNPMLKVGSMKTDMVSLRLQQLSVISRDVVSFRSGRVVAGIYKRNRLICLGIANKTNKSHPLQAQFSRHHEAIFPHAEIAAINRAMYILGTEDFYGYSIYTARTVFTGDRKSCNMGLAKPCEIHGSGCMKAIQHFNFSKAYWTIDNENYGTWEKA